MIKLTELIKEIEDGIEFVSPDETDLDYYDDLNKIQKDSGINILSDRELVLLVTRNEKVVAALYESNVNATFTFDIIVDKNERNKGIGTKLIDIGLSDYTEFKSIGYKLMLNVVNPNLIQHLQRRGLKIIDKNNHNHVTMSY